MYFQTLVKVTKRVRELMACFKTYTNLCSQTVLSRRGITHQLPNVLCHFQLCSRDADTAVAMVTVLLDHKCMKGRNSGTVNSRACTVRLRSSDVCKSENRELGYHRFFPEKKGVKNSS